MQCAAYQPQSTISKHLMQSVEAVQLQEMHHTQIKARNCTAKTHREIVLNLATDLRDDIRNQPALILVVSIHDARSECNQVT